MLQNGRRGPVKIYPYKKEGQKRCHGEGGGTTFFYRFLTQGKRGAPLSRETILPHLEDGVKGFGTAIF